MKKTEEIYCESEGIQNFFKKKVAFLGSECYDAVCITVLEGLQELGFEIHVLKSNINSWFCETIVESFDYDYDFIVTNVQWGIRWDLIEKMPPHIPRVLINGYDAVYGNKNWKDQYNTCVPNYDLPTDLNAPIFDFRWKMNPGDYKPDIVFTAQKQFDLKEYRDYYIPFGIQKWYQSDSIKPFSERKFDFSHVQGTGKRRDEANGIMNTPMIPGEKFHKRTYGIHKFPKEIEDLANKDYRENVHGYHRWAKHEDYYQLLQDSKCIIYNGIDSWPFWDSKRPWEAMASGCYFLYTKPVIDVSEYPIWDCDDFAMCRDLNELSEKSHYLFNHKDEFSKRATNMMQYATKYFSAEAISRYFLMTIKKELK